MNVPRTCRAALVVLALPLIVTAVVSAHSWLGHDDLSPPSLIQSMELTPTNQVEHSRAHILNADQAGNLAGRVVQFEQAAASLKVFFVRNGQIEQSTTTDAAGNFAVTGLTNGAYSFVASGQNGFVAHGVYVTTDAEVASQNVMQTAAVAPTFENVTSFIAEEPITSATADENDFAVNELELSQIGGGNRVQLTTEGQFVGRLVGLDQRLGDDTFASTHAQLIDSEQTRDVFINQDGTFALNDVEPGIYDFVAAGSEGFAAVSVEVIANLGEVAPAVPAQNASFGQQDLCCNGFHNHFDVCMTAPVDCGIVYEQVHYAEQCCNEVIIDEQPIGEEIVYEEPLPVADVGCGVAGGCNVGCSGGGDFGGCGGGGGGGIGGGFDIGGIVGAALGAYVLTEVLDKIGNNNNGVNRQPATPPVIVPPATPF